MLVGARCAVLINYINMQHSSQNFLILSTYKLDRSHVPISRLIIFDTTEARSRD